MVGCLSCTHPSIHLCMALTLKITVGCPSCTHPSSGTKNLAQTCRTPWSVLQRSRELWARPTVLPWSVSRDTPEKLAFHVRLLGPCFETATMEESKQETRFCLALSGRAWRSSINFPHGVELAGAKTNSDGKRRTFGHRRRCDFWLQQTVAVGSYATRRQRIAQTATMDVIDPPRGQRLPQTAQPIGESLQFSMKSWPRGAFARQGNRLEIRAS